MIRSSVEASQVYADTPRATVVQGIVKAIENGEFVPGKRLMSERALAEKFQVARVTVRSALARLEEMGYVERLASGRRRVAAGKVAQNAERVTSRGLMQNTMVLLTRQHGAPSRKTLLHRMHELDLGLFDTVRAEGRHCLSLCAEQINGALQADLLDDQPLAILSGLSVETQSGIPGLLLAAHERGIPVIVNSDELAYARLDRVVSDHEAGVYELTRYLIETRGRRRILQMGQEADSYWYAARRKGYERAMREAGLEPLPPFVHDEVFNSGVASDPRTFRRVSERYAGVLAQSVLNADDPVDAVLCLSDRGVFPTAAACRLLGRMPNTDIDIAGYDNYWETCEEYEWEAFAPIATVDKHDLACGKIMGHMILDRVTGALPEYGQCRKLKPDLVILDSKET